MLKYLTAKGDQKHCVEIMCDGYDKILVNVEINQHRDTVVKFVLYIPRDDFKDADQINVETRNCFCVFLSKG